MPVRTAMQLGRIAHEAHRDANMHEIYGLKTEIKGLLATDHETKSDDFLSMENYYDTNNQKYIDTEGFKGLVICNQRNDTTVNPEYYGGETQTLYVLGESNGHVFEFKDDYTLVSDLSAYTDGDKSTLQVIKSYLEAEQAQSNNK